MLSDAERTVLYECCVSHTVARCAQCHEDLTAGQVGASPVDGRRDFCPMCGVDLTEALRWHIVTCERVASLLDETMEQGRLLRKASEAERTRSEMLRADSEAIAQRILQNRRR